jgi:hypothetical protein
MKNNLILLLFLLFVIAKANAQEICSTHKDTVSRESYGCKYTVIKNKYTIDTLYAEIAEQMKVEFVFTKIFGKDSAMRVPDHILPLVKIYPVFFSIENLNTNEKEHMVLGREPKKYEKIISSIIESTSKKVEGEVLYTKGWHCYNGAQGNIFFYVFPKKGSVP